MTGTIGGLLGSAISIKLLGETMRSSGLLKKKKQEKNGGKRK